MVGQGRMRGRRGCGEWDRGGRQTVMVLRK